MLDLFVNNVQCKHIFYACAPDAFALSSLDDYRNNFIIASSITLIKSKAFEDSDIYLPFEIIELPLLFRGDQNNPDDIDGSDNGWNKFTRSHQRPKTNTTTRGRRSQDRVPGSTWGPEENLVLLNIEKERVDSQLEKLDLKAIESFNKRAAQKKLCMWYHLGVCKAGSRCAYSHGPRLNAKELHGTKCLIAQGLLDNGNADFELTYSPSNKSASITLRIRFQMPLP